jgi:hypothetical protein
MIYQVLRGIFDDDDNVFEFQRDLKRLGAVLMPFARAIQCLEAKETNPADVYTYWLAVVAHLHDLIVKDSDKSKYAEESKNRIRQIANYRFAELIENDRASFLRYLLLSRKSCSTYYFESKPTRNPISHHCA